MASSRIACSSRSHFLPAIRYSLVSHYRQNFDVWMTFEDDFKATTNYDIVKTTIFIFGDSAYLVRQQPVNAQDITEATAQDGCYGTNGPMRHERHGSGLLLVLRVSVDLICVLCFLVCDKCLLATDSGIKSSARAEKKKSLLYKDIAQPEGELDPRYPVGSSL